MEQLINIQPMFENLLKSPTIENVNLLDRQLLQINWEDIPYSMRRFQDMYLQCLITQLTKINATNLRNADEIKIKLIHMIVDLSNASKHLKIAPLKCILVAMIMEIFDFKKTLVYDHTSEELKLAVIECIEISFLRLTTDCLVEFYTKDSSQILSQICFVCCHMITMESYKKLKIAAIRCLNCLFYVHDKANFADNVVRNQVANQTFLFLPKTVATLTKIALGDEKQSVTMFSLSGKSLGRILCLIMEDYNESIISSNISIEDFKNLLIIKGSNIAQTDNEVLGSFAKHKSIEDKTKYLEKLQRTPEWLTAASSKLLPHIQSLHKLIGHQNHSVRLELAIMFCNLIEKCFKYMLPCMKPLLEITISLSQDNDQNISEMCHKTVGKIINNDQRYGIEIIEEIFHSIMIRLPRIIYTGQDDEKLASLLLFKGILVILSTSKLRAILSNTEILDKFMVILMTSVEISRSIELLQDEHSIRTIDTNDKVSIDTYKPWKQFKNVSNTKQQKILSEICQIIAKSNSCQIVVNFLLDLLHKATHSCNEAIVLLQLIMVKCTDKIYLITFLDEFLSNVHWQLAIQSNQCIDDHRNYGESVLFEDRTEGLYESALSIRYTDIRYNNMNENSNNVMDYDESMITINDAKFNVLYTCLLLECIGIYAMVLEQDFQPFVIKTLYQILDKAGSSNYVIHEAGMFALNKVRLALNYGDISDLIHNNSHFIAHFVNLSLKKMDQCKSALDVLNVVLKYSTIESIPYLENIIITVLQENSKNYQTSENMISFLKVFRMILSGINNWTKNDNNLSEVNQSTTTETGTHDDKTNFYKELLIMLKDKIEVNENLENNEDEILNDENYSDTIGSEEEENEIITNENESETIQPEKPKHVEITINILNRCLKSISSKQQIEQIIAIETISIGLNIIRNYENDLLPMVHQIWYPFSERLNETNPIILRRCLMLLDVLGRLAKDFICTKTSKDILPHIIRFLKTSQNESLQKKYDLSFEHTQQFKLLKEIFQYLPELIKNLEISEFDFNQILDVTVPYIHREQPILLQQYCTSFLDNLIDYDAPAIYVKLYKNSKISVNCSVIYEKYTKRNDFK